MFGLYKEPQRSRIDDLLSAPTLAETYSSILKIHSLQKINRIIANDAFEDSAAVYERFFLDCETEIFIAARGLKDAIFCDPDVINSAADFLQKTGVKLLIHIPADNESEISKIESSPFLRTLLKVSYGKNTNKLKISYYERSSSDGEKFLGDLPSLTTGDMRMYRVRSWQMNGDYSNNANAKVNFSDVEKTEAMRADVESRLKLETKIVDKVY